MRSENRESRIFAATEEAVRWSADEFNYLICVFSREDTLHHNGVAIPSTNRVLMMARGRPAITLVICNSRILCIHIIWYRFSSFSSSSSFLFSSFHLRSSASKVRSYRFCYYNCRIRGPHAAKATGYPCCAYHPAAAGPAATDGRQKTIGTGLHSCLAQCNSDHHTKVLYPSNRYSLFRSLSFCPLWLAVHKGPSELGSNIAWPPGSTRSGPSFCCGRPLTRISLRQYRKTGKYCVWGCFRV